MSPTPSDLAEGGKGLRGTSVHGNGSSKLVYMVSADPSLMVEVAELLQAEKQREKGAGGA